MIKVAVLYGGVSAERDISLASGAKVYDSIIRQGYRNAELIDYNPSFAKDLHSHDIDVAFIALHGRYGEDGCVQGLLECAGIPYTHSGVLASSIAMNKAISYRLFYSAGIPVPESRVMRFSSHRIGEHPMEPPYIIKPVDEGSSVGIALIESYDDMVSIEPAYVGCDMLVSRYIEGRELTAAVMDNKTLGVLEITNFGKILSYDGKYNKADTKYICPAQIPTSLEERIRCYAEEAHKTLGCAGVTRIDFRYDPIQDIPYVLELNTQPGLTARSMVPAIATAHGISFDEIVDYLIKEAFSRRK